MSDEVEEAFAREASSRKEMPGESASEAMEQHRSWRTLSRLPLKLRVRIPLPGFCVGSLIGLHEGGVISSSSPVVEELPIELGTVQLGWGDLEVVEQRLAIRLTRLQ